MTAMRSEISSASSWSCVTKTNVVPTARCTARQFGPQRLAQLGVQRAERLVEQQHRRPAHQGPGQRDALLLAAGELGGVPAGELGSRTRSSASPARVRRSALLTPGRQRSPYCHVLRHGQVREQRVALEDRVDRTPVGRRAGEIAAVEQDASLGRGFEAADHLERRRLAAAGRPEQREELARGDPQVDAVDGDRGAVHLAEARQFERAARGRVAAVHAAQSRR